MFKQIYQQEEAQKEALMAPGKAVLVYHPELLSPVPQEALSLQVVSHEGTVLSTYQAGDWWDTLPKVTQSRRIISAQGWTQRAEFQGVLLKSVYEDLQSRFPESFSPLQSSSGWLQQTNVCGAEEWLPLSEALSQKALLCTHLNGTPLSPLQGGPLHLRVFHCYEHKGLPQLQRLCFWQQAHASHLPKSQAGFWGERGYEPSGSIVPGNYFALDLGQTKPVNKSAEVSDY
ncbi:MAG: molybdopterin-dependent oxidoreductase [Cyanobacteria bacterium]|nr:molybdopterin-dependent oxidoreductase [Cyanobacteriota bacterium]